MKKFLARKTYSQMITTLVIISFISMITSLFIGQLRLSFTDFTEVLTASLNHTAHPLARVIWHIRLPRIILAIIVGASLAVSGSVMQACIQNPLADPYLLGVSAGATTGTTFALLFGVTFLGRFGTSIFAFLGGIAATLIILKIGARSSFQQLTTIILAGVVINAICQALTSLFIYLSSNVSGVKNVSFWTMGSLANATWFSVLLLGISSLVALSYFLRHAKTLNLLMMGSETASTLGIQTEKQQQRFMIVTAGLTAIIVSQCGIIAFVGLIVPHMSRVLVGVNHQKMLPITAILGALLLLCSDSLARVIIPNGELPIGIITSLIGAPIFMHLLIKQKGRDSF